MAEKTRRRKSVASIEPEPDNELRQRVQQDIHEQSQLLEKLREDAKRTREGIVLRLAKELDVLREERLEVEEHYIQSAFGGTGPSALAEAAGFGTAHGCTFRYSRTKRLGTFSRKYRGGGRA
jgi:hypothetical protein